MLILDISDPTQPRKVAFYPAQGQFVGLEVAGDYVYIVDALRTPTGSNRGTVLRVIDVHDPSHPIEISTIKRKRSFGMLFVKNYLYITHRWSNTLEILDVTNPFELRVVTVMNFPVGGFFPAGDKLYIARMVPVSRGWTQERLTVADISDAAHPKVLSDIYIPQGPTFESLGGVSFYGKYIYYYEKSSSPPTIHVFRLMDERLIEVGFYEKYFSLMSSVGTYIYATTAFELYILEFMERNVVSIQPKGKLSSTWGKLKNRREQ